ncbi:MAG: glutathione S-transferase [Thalassovita sp.]
MKLISSTTSPYVRKVLIVLAETGQSDDVELVSVATTPLNTPDSVIAANPIGKIPALVREGQATLSDSRVICQYFDDRAGGSLYSQRDRWELLALEAAADAIMDAAVQIVMETRLRPAHLIDEGWLDAQWAKVERGVAALGDTWMGHLNGPLNIGQIAVGCALAYLDFRLPDRVWRKGNDALDDWYAVFADRPSMTATVPA